MIAFSIGGSIASAVVIYQLGVRAVWTMFKRTFLKRKTDSDFEDLLKGTVPIFLAAYFVGIALVAIPSALILASTTGLPIGVTTLEMLVYCSLVCGFAAVPYMTATIG